MNRLLRHRKAGRSADCIHIIRLKRKIICNAAKRICVHFRLFLSITMHIANNFCVTTKAKQLF